MDKENLMFEIPKTKSHAIKVIGVGGGGSNAVNHMFHQGITGVDFVVCNTDAQALNSSPIPYRIQLGASITEGLGAGANPELGEQAALETAEEIKTMLGSNTKMVFITAGMGGGTGTGAAPIIAGIAKEMGILTVGICTAPFFFEGKRRLEQSQVGIEKLRKSVDSLIVINNDKLRELYGNLGYKAGFAKADEVLTTAAKGIAEVITHHYMANIDLRDARTVLADSGTAIMGSAKASGDNKAQEAINSALDSPLLNNNKITGAKNVLLLIVSGSSEITLDEIGVINDHIQQEAGNSANIIMGIGEDSDLGEEICVTVVATGFPMDEQRYTGREDEKVLHRLEDEQPLIQEFSPINSGVKTPLRKSNSIEKTPIKIETEDRSQNTVFILEEDDIEEETINGKEDHDFKENDEEITLIQNEKPLKAQTSLFETTEEDSFDTVEASDKEDAQSEQTIRTFRLDLDDTEEEAKLEQEKRANSEPRNGTENDREMRAFENKDFSSRDREARPKSQLESNLSEEVLENIRAQRERLKKYNFKFSNNLSQQEIEDLENTPAYQRDGLKLDESTPNANETSGTKLTTDSHNELKLRPNEFLHKNVD